MPEAPAPGCDLSSTTTSAPEPRPRAASSFARWYAVERPWMPAPTTTKRAEAGIMVYCLPGNGVSKYLSHRTMARTGSPATRLVAAVERAVAVLDILAEAGELGTNEVARRTGLNASTASRQLATLTSVGLVSHVLRRAATGSGRGWWSSATQRWHGLDVRELAHPAAAAARARDGRDRDAVGARRARRDHDRLRAERLVGAERRPARAAEHRARDRHRQGGARLRRRGSARGPVCGGTPPARSPTGTSSRPRRPPSVSRATRVRSASVRTTSTRSPRRCSAAGASWWR